MAVQVTINLKETGGQAAAKTYQRLSQSVQHLNQDFERQLATNQRMAASAKATNASFERQITFQQRLAVTRKSADAAFEKSLATEQEIQRATVQLTREMERQTSAAKEVTKATVRWASEQEAAASLDMTDHLSDEAKATLAAAAAQKELAKQTKEANNARRDAGGRGGTTSGSQSTALNDRTIGQLVGGLSGLNVPGVQNLRAFADIADVTENLPKLAMEIKGLGAASLATTGIIGAVGLAFTALKFTLDASAKSAREDIALIERRVDAERKTREDLRSLSVKYAEQRIADLKQEIEETRRLRDEIDQIRDAARQPTQGEDRSLLGINTSVEDVRNKIEGDVSNIVSTVSQIGDAFGINVGVIGESNKKLDEYNKKLDEQKAELERLNEQVIERLRLQEAERAAYEGAIGAEQQRIDTTLQNERDIRSLTAEQAREQRDEAQRRLELNQEFEKKITDDLQVQLQRRVQIQTELINAIAAGDSDKAAELQTILVVTDQRLGVLSETLTDLQPAIDADTAAVERLTNTVIPLVEQREKEQRTLDRVKELQKQRAELLKKEEDALKSLETARRTLADFEAQIADEARIRAQENAIRSRQSAELNAIDTQIEAAKQAEKAAQTQKKLTEIETQRVAKTQEFLEKARETEALRQEKFSTDLERFARDTAIKVQRIFRESNRAIDVAVADVDVVGFEKAIQDRNTKLEDLQEDANNDAADRLEDFNRESLRLVRERERGLQQIQIQADQQRLQLQQQTANQELTLLQRLQQQRAALVARHTQELENFRAQQEVAAINRRRQLLIADINARQQEYDVLRKQAHDNAFNIGRNMVLGFLSGASAQQRRAVQTVSNAGNQVIQSIKNVLPSFANEGIATRPTLALVGDKPGKYEAMINFSPSEGLDGELRRRGFGGNTTVNVSIPGANFGGMNSGEMDKFFNRMGWVITQSLEQVRP